MNSSSTPQWISRLCEDVQDGHFSTNLGEEDFNDVLKWLLKREFTTGKLLSQSMLRFFDNEDKARQNTFLALDDYLFVFSNDSYFAKLGLPDTAEQKGVKVRYRRLIQLYHPDKGLAEAAGLSHRAENINQAHDRIKSGQGTVERMAPPTYRHQPPRVPVVVRPSPNKKVYRSKVSDNIRWMLGSPQKVAFVLMSVLVLVAASILFTVYNDNKPIKYPQYSEQASAPVKGADTPITQGVAQKRFTSVADLDVDRNMPPALQPAKVKQIRPPVVETKEAPRITEAAGEKLVVAKPTRTSEPLPKPAPTPAPKPAPTPAPVETVPVQIAVATEKAPTPEKIIETPTETPVVAKTPIVAKPTRTSESLPKPAPTPAAKPAPTPAPVETVPVQVAAATEKAPTPEVEVKKAENKRIVETPTEIVEAPTETPVVTKQVKTSMPMKPASSPKHITTLSEIDQQQSLDVLVGYVDGMLEGNVSKSLRYVNDTVLVNGEQTRKDELRQAYSVWLNESTQREYKVKVSNVAVHNGLVRISGKTNIRFKYPEREPLKYKGVLNFDIQLDTFVGGKIVAISNG